MTGIPIPDVQNRTFAFLYVGRQLFDWFTDYTISSSILNATNSFSFHAPAKSADTFRDAQQKGLFPGQKFHLFVRVPGASKEVLQHRGYIDDITIAETREHGAMLTLTGRDHLSPIVDSDVLPGFALENVTFYSLVKRLLLENVSTGNFPYFSASDIVINNDANRDVLTGKPAKGVTLSDQAPVTLPRASGYVPQVEGVSPVDYATKLEAAQKRANAINARADIDVKDAKSVMEEMKIDQARPHPGETVYEYLYRHARRFGLMIWGSADGKVVFSRPNYDQKAIYQLRLKQGLEGAKNNASMSRHRSFKHRPSEIHVYGHTHGNDSFRSKIHAVLYDEEVKDAGHFRTLTIHDNTARSQNEALLRAHQELSKRKRGGDVITAEVAGHASEDGTVYAIDTIADVQWDLGDVHGPMYVAARTFTKSRQGGTRTHLELVPKHSITLFE